MPILIGADVGGSKTAVGVSEPGGPILPGRMAPAPRSAPAGRSRPRR